MTKTPREARRKGAGDSVQSNVSVVFEFWRDDVESKV